MFAGNQLINNTCITFQSNYPQSYSSHGYQDYVSSGPPPPPGNFYGQGGQPAYPGSAYNNYSPYGMYKIGRFMYDFYRIGVIKRACRAVFSGGIDYVYKK